MYEQRYSEVRSRLNSVAQDYAKQQLKTGFIKAGKALLKQSGKLAAKLAKKAAQVFLQVIIKFIMLIFAKVSLFIVIVVLLIALAVTFAFDYKAACKNLFNSETTENQISYIQSVSNAAEIPPQYIPIYTSASLAYNVDWWILAAIHYTETSFSANVKTSSVGAIGPMQFMPSTWYGTNNNNQDPKIIKNHRGFGVDANNDGKADPYDLEDAVFAAANYLNYDHYSSQPLDALSLYGASMKYAQNVFALGKTYSGQNLGDAGIFDQISQWWDSVMIEMSADNKNLLKHYQNTSDKSIDKIVDKFEQELTYKTTWGLLAALDTSNQMVNQNDDLNYEQWSKLLKPSFKYKNCKKITETTTTVLTKTDSKTTVDRTTETYKVLSQANTFAGVFNHFYKSQTTVDTKTQSSEDVTTTIKTKIIQDVPSYTSVNPDFSKLQSIISSQNFDKNDFRTILELADTYDSGKLNLNSIDTNSFWAVSVNQLDENKIFQGGNESLPGSIGTGQVGNFPTWPISCSNRITSGFGWRIHPVSLTRKFHSGIDISGANGSYQIKGQPILSVSPGKVIFVGWLTAYGNAVIVDHGNGVSTFYGHMMAKSDLPLGKQVSAGETIGYVGTTGYSTGEHLHFEVRINGVPRNPLDWTFGGTIPTNLNTYQN